MAHSGSEPLPDGVLADSTSAPRYYYEALQDAERLLKYAAEIGIDIDTETRNAILHARAVHHDVGPKT